MWDTNSNWSRFRVEIINGDFAFTFGNGYDITIIPDKPIPFPEYDSEDWGFVDWGNVSLQWRDYEYLSIYSKGFRVNIPMDENTTNMFYSLIHTWDAQFGPN